MDKSSGFHKSVYDVIYVDKTASPLVLFVGGSGNKGLLYHNGISWNLLKCKDESGQGSCGVWETAEIVDIDFERLVNMILPKWFVEYCNSGKFLDDLNNGKAEDYFESRLKQHQMQGKMGDASKV